MRFDLIEFAPRAISGVLKRAFERERLLASFEAGVTAQLSKIWVLAIIMYLATVIFAVKLMFENNTREDKIIRNQDKIQRDLSALYDYLEHNHIMTADEIKAVTEQKDKPSGSIRPGSRPSIEYMNLRVEKEADHDTGSEDQESA